MKKKIIKFIIDKAKRSKLIQSVFEQPIDLGKLVVKGVFTDSKGVDHELYEGLRTKLKPGWEQIFKQEGKRFDKSAQRIDEIVQNEKISVERMEAIINLYSSGIKDSKVLEIGCHAGGASYSFAEKGADEVIGTEFSGYKVESVNNDKYENNELIKVNEELNDLRGLVKEKFKNTSNVSFLDDDICNSKIEQNSFDLICSWDVLEHLHDPLKALQNISSLLNDTGIAVHEYNPFHSLIGGHSACTIDFPWGHVILNDNDFLSFNEKHQPEKLNTAMSFYNNGLNRMTIKDLKDYCAEANLEILSLIKYPKEQDLRMLDKKTLKRAVENYPSLEMNDLITYRVIVVLRKLQESKSN